MIFLLLAGALPLASARSTTETHWVQAPSITFTATDGTQKPFLTSTLHDGDPQLLDLFWPNNARVSWTLPAKSVSARADIPPDVVADAKLIDIDGTKAIEIQCGQVKANIPMDLLVAMRSDDDRVVLQVISSAGKYEAGGVPAPPHSIASTGLTTRPSFDPSIDSTSVPSTGRTMDPTRVAWEVVNRMINTNGAKPSDLVTTLDGRTKVAVLPAAKELTAATAAAAKLVEEFNRWNAPAQSGDSRRMNDAANELVVVLKALAGAVGEPARKEANAVHAAGEELRDKLSGLTANGKVPTRKERIVASEAVVAFQAQLKKLDGPGEESLAIKSALEAPTTANPTLDMLLRATHGLRFLRDVEWKVKTFDNDGESSLGASFHYENSHPFDISGDSTSALRGKSWDFAVDGNIAFDDDVNPADFISARLTFDYFQSHGGIRQELSDDEQKRAVALANGSARYADRDEWLASPEWTELTGLARKVFDTQVYWEAGIDASFESDQSFDAKNYTLGAHVALDVKAWNDRSEAGTLNVFDYPAALVRYLSGFDQELRPRGNAIPTALLAIDHVEPDGNTPRANVGDDSSYERLKLELAYKAPLAILEGKQYSLTAVWRSYYELDPSSAVRAADLDRFDYFTLAIESNQGLFASFSRGQQPFDDDSAEVYALGWNFKF